MSLIDDELGFTAGMTDQQRLLFSSEMVGRRKSPMVGVILALFLGGLGAHQFYLGRTGLGIVYALLCWTVVPAVVALVEMFLMPGRVRAYNAAVANEISAKIRMLGAAPVTS
jgi:TM2 domain-containing membrane protein YozV